MGLRWPLLAFAVLVACARDEPEPEWRTEMRALLYERIAVDGTRWGRWKLDPLVAEDTPGDVFAREGAVEFLDRLRADASSLPALERALLQRDLWPVHDWVAGHAARSGDPEAERLARRLAGAMTALALDADEIARLPDPLARTVASRRFPPAWDRARPHRPFLPPDLLEADRPWVCLGDEGGRVFAPFHLDATGGRASFEVHARLPGGRDATLAWVARVRAALAAHAGEASLPRAARLPDPPAGTLLALVRRAFLVDRDGDIRVSPLVELVQFRVHGAGLTVRAFGQEMRDQPAVFEWNLAPGTDPVLVPVGRADAGFPGTLRPHYDPFESGSAPEPVPILESCVACHDGTRAARSIQSLSGDLSGMGFPSRLHASAPGAEAATFARWKADRHEFRQLRAAFGGARR